MSFSYKAFGGGLKLSRQEAEHLRQASALLAAAYPRIGLATCLSQLQRFCCSFLPELRAGTDLPFAARLPPLFDRLDELSREEHTVYVQVSGIALALPSWSFGPVTFMPGNHPSIESARCSIRDPAGNHPSPIPEGVVVAVVSAAGSQAMASTSSLETVNRVLDTLQLLTVQENHDAFSEANETLGFALRCSQPLPLIPSNLWMLSRNAPAWCASIRPSGIAPSGPLQCVIDPEAIERITARGGQSFADMLSAAPPSAFDANCLSAVAWIAAAIRERDFARKYLCLFIAMEALFTPDNDQSQGGHGYVRSIVPIEEGLAFLLGKDAPSRRKIVESFRDLRRSRNQIVHRGYSSIERSGLIRLASFACASCVEAAKRRGSFREPDSFKNWLLDCKYSGASPATDSAAQKQ